LCTDKESKILTLQSALDKVEAKTSSELSQLQNQLRVRESQYTSKLSELESKLQSAENASSKPVRAGNILWEYFFAVMCTFT
jgi:hypothetical protein